MSTGAERAARHLGSVERAIALLDALADSPEPLGTNELARRVGTNASTASRLLATLAASGLVERLAETGRYRLGVRLLELGSRVQARLDIRALARPLLVRLEAQTGETATLSLPAAGAAVTAEYVASRASVRSMADVGRPSIAHATSVGRVMLAFAPDDATPQPATLEAYTERTIVDPAALARAVAEVRRDGYAVSLGEREPDLNAIAAPVLGAGGTLVAILGVQGPASRFDESRIAAAIAPMREAAMELTRALGIGPSARVPDRQVEPDSQGRTFSQWSGGSQPSSTGAL